MGEAEINRLPDPEVFRDALFLRERGVWSPSDLDESDALLVALVRKLMQPKRSD